MFKLTAQEWFDGAWRRAHKRELAIGADGYGCSYVAGCFLGVSMPPEACIAADAIGGAEECIGYSIIGVDDEDDPGAFLRQLQVVHDSAFCPPSHGRGTVDLPEMDQWLPKLRAIATEYGLTVPEGGA